MNAFKKLSIDDLVQKQQLNVSSFTPQLHSKIIKLNCIYSLENSQCDVAVDFIPELCALNTTLKTHKKGEVLHKINIHFVLMYFMLFFFCFSGAGKCNIIGWMSKNELLFNLLQYSGSLWSCSIVMFGSNRFTIHAPDDLFHSEFQKNSSLRNLQTSPHVMLFFCSFVLLSIAP